MGARNGRPEDAASRANVGCEESFNVSNFLKSPRGRGLESSRSRRFHDSGTRFETRILEFCFEIWKIFNFLSSRFPFHL